MLNFFFSNIKPTFVQEETINESFSYKNESFVYSLYLIQKYLSIREKEVLP